MNTSWLMLAGSETAKSTKAKAGMPSLMHNAPRPTRGDHINLLGGHHSNMVLNHSRGDESELLSSQDNGKMVTNATDRHCLATLRCTIKHAYK
ncbi:hypothetical protein DMENIID0001_053960 [Sergentomyia squamirostris]